ncbi:MAG: cytochrome c5 family protein [Gammaproteobacteria bacterium HGW-Gammaproteobacteria-14]|nr:MAG: cytochrome c5 family protein [Gammaproteobacteria bacterium HGW-Gammaproteobacteria-14]
MRKLMLSLLLSSLAMAASASVEDMYKSSCTFCHSTGAAGAPKTGDKAAWAPRLEKGMETLVKNSRSGIGGMPPMGMCNACSDDDFKALIEFMTK